MTRRTRGERRKSVRMKSGRNQGQARRIVVKRVAKGGVEEREECVRQLGWDLGFHRKDRESQKSRDHAFIGRGLRCGHERCFHARPSLNFRFPFAVWFKTRTSSRDAKRDPRIAYLPPPTRRMATFPPPLSGSFTSLQVSSVSCSMAACFPNLEDENRCV